MGNAVSEASAQSLFEAAAENGDGGLDRLPDVLTDGVLRETTNDKGETALMVAAAKSNIKVIRALLYEDSFPTELKLVDYVNLAVSSTNQTALFYAVSGGSVEAVEILASAGASLNHRDSRGATALFLAAFQGKEGLVDLLLRLGVDPLYPMAGGATILHASAQQGHAAAARAILQSLVSSPDKLKLLLNAQKEKDRTTALHLAAQSGHGLVIEVLLACKADDLLLTSGGYTALHLAVLKGRTAAVEILCRLGSVEALEKASSEGVTPSELAERLGQRAVASFIKSCLTQRKEGGELPASPVGSDQRTMHPPISSAETATTELSATEQATSVSNVQSVQKPAHDSVASAPTNGVSQHLTAAPAAESSSRPTAPAPATSTAAAAGSGTAPSGESLVKAMAAAPIYAKGQRVILNLDLLPSVTSDADLKALERGQLYRHGDIIRIKV